MDLRLRTIAMLALGACSGEGTDDDTDGGGGLGQDEFEDQYIERYCAEWANCNTAGDECPISEGSATGTTSVQCDYDPVAAQECLDGTWTCNTDFPGLEYVVSSAACLEVCGSATTTGSQM